ncbi:glycosyltransferase family 39 protein [Acetobacteraceae bacterium]|nr:glycosyltransferase family 39 protein [Acetobacteraceae bacterium]
MQKPILFYVAVIGALIAFCLALPARQTLAPFDRDEARYMQASRQMDQTNDFIQIYFQDTPRNHQPAGLYWLEVAALKIDKKIYGNKIISAPFVYRLPALFAAALIGGLTAFIGAFLFSPWIGISATILLSSTVLFSVESRLATPDPCLLAFIMAMMSLLVLILRQQERGEKTSFLYALGYWGIMGGGLLIKGPIILLPAFLTPLALSLTGNGKELWKRLSLWGIIFSLLLALPWYLAIYLKTDGQFFAYALKHNFFGKIVGAQETHGFPPGYYLVTFLLAFWPGSYLFVKSFPEVWKARFTWQVRFLLCWIIPFWLIFECVPTKLPHYILPIYPAIAILTSAFFFKESAFKEKYFKISVNCYGILWGFLSLSLPIGVVLLLKKDHAPISLILWGIIVFSLLSMIGAIFYLLKDKNLTGFVLLLFSALSLEMGIYLCALPVFSIFHLSEKTARIFEMQKPCAQSRLISISYKEPSLVFLVGGERTILSGKLKALSLLKAENSCDILLLDWKREGDFLDLASQNHLSLQNVAQLQGQNYSNGHYLDLRFYKKSP